MTVTSIRTFDHSLSTTQEWLKDIQEELKLGDLQEAFVATKAVLQTLRDRLSVEEAADFAAQLPMLMQGVYYHEWRPGNKPVKYKNKEEFLSAVSGKTMGKFPAEDCVISVLKVLERRLPEGEIEDIKAVVPEEIAELWP